MRLARRDSSVRRRAGARAVVVRLPRRILTAAVLCGLSVPLAAPAAAETLRAAVQAAVTTNPAGRAANADVQASALELLQLRGDYMPSVELFGEVGGAYVDAPNRLTPANNGQVRLSREIGVAAEYTLFDGYRRANRVYANAAALDGAIFRLLDASETMALNAVEAYVDVLRHRQLLGVMAENVARHREIARQVQDLVDSGAVPASDAFEAQERTLAARLAHVEVEKALADARARYKAVIGHAPSGRMSLPRVPEPPASLQTLTVMAVKNSYQVRYAETLVQQAGFDKGVKEADLLPELGLRAGVTHNLDRAGTPGPETDAFVGLRLSWEFSTGGRRATRGALTARVREAMAERDEVVRDVQELAARAWNGYHAAVRRAQLTDQQLRASLRIRDQYRVQFEGGTRSLLDLLSAERAYYNIRFQDVSAEASLAFARFRVLAAQSRLSGFFGVDAADIPLDPGFQARAQGRPAAIFNTEIRALE